MRHLEQDVKDLMSQKEVAPHMATPEPNSEPLRRPILDERRVCYKEIINKAEDDRL